MSAENPTAFEGVAQVEHRLRGLVEVAVESHSNVTVESILAGDVLEGHISDFTSSLSGVVDAQLPAILETAARKIFYDILKTTRRVTAESSTLWTFLDVLLQICETRQNGRSIIWYLIEELVESQTADSCRLIFDYLDTRRERLTQREFQVTHLIILRTCNELLRRLSRAEDATFCGRVFFFLFQVFPLGEQSSVNLRGEFHSDNVTLFDETPRVQEDGAGGDAMNVDEESAGPTNSAAPGAKDAEGSANKDSIEEFYPVFWRLQQDFSMPTRLIEIEAHFAAFKDGLEQTIKRFAETPVVKTKSTADESRGTKRKRHAEEMLDYQGDYNPKYLTSRDLFDLELSDLSFQRHILVQALILLDFLLSLSEQAHKKMEDSGIPRLNTAVNYNFTLPNDKKEWARAVRGRITSYLQEGPDGNFYHRMVQTVLARDKNWIWWKIQRCPPIVASPLSVEECAAAREGCARATANRRMRAKPMGAMDLTFLNEADGSNNGRGGGLDSLRDAGRCQRPGIAELVERIGREELDLDFADDVEKAQIKVRTESLTWRAMRAAARTSLGKLDKLDAGKNLAELLTVVPPVVVVEHPGQGGSDHRSAAAAGDAVVVAAMPAEDGKTPEVQVA